MDQFNDIFKMQGELDAYIRDKRELSGEKGYTKAEWIQKKCLALLDETAEVLNEVNYKWWKNPKPIDSGALAEELIDILHFWVSMCIDAGLTAEKAYEIYKRKNDENRARQEGKSAKPGYELK